MLHRNGHIERSVRGEEIHVRSDYHSELSAPEATPSAS